MLTMRLFDSPYNPVSRLLFACLSLHEVSKRCSGRSLPPWSRNQQISPSGQRLAERSRVRTLLLPDENRLNMPLEGDQLVVASIYTNHRDLLVTGIVKVHLGLNRG